MEKKPNVFVNKINKAIHNNENVYFSQGEKIEKEEQKNTTNFELPSKTIEQKIKEIFDSNTYIYKADVEITTKDTKMTKRLIGKNGKYLITMDNELIPIEEITDIKIDTTELLPKEERGDPLFKMFKCILQMYQISILMHSNSLNSL